jgi:hypothetical protein
MNDSNKNRKFEEVKVKVTAPENASDKSLGNKILGALNPFNYFGSKDKQGAEQQKDFLNPNYSPAYSEADFSKRQKVPVEDGKSQYKFIDMQASEKPLAGHRDLRLFTLEEVMFS